VNVIPPDSIDFDSYFQEQQVDRAKIRRASSWADAVIDRLYGQGSEQHWTGTGFDKMHGKFDFRAGELTVWAGINKHGKTTFLSNVMLNVMQRDKKVCIASMEMKPDESMAKMTKQAAGVEKPSEQFIREFATWTDDKLWIYDHLGKLAASRVLALATYVRKEMGIDHLVVDSLMKCGIGVDDLTGQKDFVDALSTITRDTGLHIHLVCHMRKGEDEKKAPDKFAVKGAGEISDMPDNIAIVFKNLKKADEIAAAEREKDELKRDARMKEAHAVPDAFVRIAGQRNHPWEGSFAFWFHKGSQQFTESQWEKPRHLDLEMGITR
jgi:twinkle protein